MDGVLRDERDSVSDSESLLLASVGRCGGGVRRSRRGLCRIGGGGATRRLSPTGYWSMFADPVSAGQFQSNTLRHSGTQLGANFVGFGSTRMESEG